MTLVVQLVFVSWTFPIERLLTEDPLFHIDGAYHWYQMSVAVALGAEGRLTGYDPFFAAGHVGGVTLNASAKTQALAAYLLRDFVTITVAYKLVVFAFAVLGPTFVPFAAGILGLHARVVWSAAALGVCLWWASAFRWYHTAGMASFVFAAFLSLLFAALIAHALRRGSGWSSSIGAGFAGAAGFLVHPLFPLAAAIAVLGYVVLQLRTIDWQSAGFRLAVVSVMSLAPNLPWLYALVQVGESELGAQPYQRRVDPFALMKEALGIWSESSLGAKLNTTLLIACVYAAFGAKQRADQRLAQAAIAGWLATGLFAHLGAAIPLLSNLQPNRFGAVAFLLLVIPAAIGLWQATESVWAKANPSIRLRALVVLAACAVPLALSVREVAREVSSTPTGRYGAAPPEVRPIGRSTRELVEWLQANTSRDARVLFETSKGRVHDGAHIAGYVAIASDRELIGGPYPFMFKASAWDGQLFGQPVHLVSDEQLLRHVVRYNIGWIVAHSDALRQRLDHVSGVSLVGTPGGLSAYRVDGASSYFLAGSGTIVERGFNKIRLRNLTQEQTVIKFHYVRGLVAMKPFRVEPHFIDETSHPFVRIVGPPGHDAILTFN